MIIIYYISAIILSVIPVNNNFREAESGIDIYIMTTGSHTDLVLPIKNEFKDWSILKSYKKPLSNDTNINYVAFGWGDKRFYLNKREYPGMKIVIELNALFFSPGSAIHVVFYNRLNETSHCKKIKITDESYKKLVEYIDSSFTKDIEGNLYINDVSYGLQDSFYDAEGKYNPFNNCNTWANRGLKVSGLKACLWTTLGKGIKYQYDMKIRNSD